MAGCIRLADYTKDLEVTSSYPRRQLIFSQDPIPGTLLQEGVHVITMTVTDPSGRVTTCEKILHVECSPTFYNVEQTAECPAGQTGDAVTIAAGLYSGSTQAEADAAALAAAEAQLCCVTCPECPECESTLPPLHAAIYESNRDVIYGVQQGRIYKINATTGALIAQARLREDVMGQNFICYYATTDRIYVTVWGLKTEVDFRNGIAILTNNPGEKLLICVHPDTLAIVSSHNLSPSSALTFTALNSNQPGEIFADLTNGLIVGALYPENSTHSLWKFSPGTLAFTTGTTFPSYGDSATHAYVPNRVLPDPDTGRFWVFLTSAAPPVGIMARSIRTPQLDGAGIVNVGIGDVADANHTVPVPTAMAYRSSYLYFTLGTAFSASMNYSGRYVIKKKSDNTGSRVVIDTGRTAARPFNIRYNSVDDRIYVPTWPDDAVVVIDPTNDTVESVKTGFDSPWDVVFTPTKKWAVQLGSPGLREIT